MKSTPQRFAENPSYLEYEKLLKQLQDLNQAGNNDSAEADVLREKMVDLWYSFSEAEQQRLDGLSADLYSFSNEEEPTELTPEEEKQLRDECNKSFSAGEWETLLGLLRKGQQPFAKVFLAAWRARCWHELGHFFPANWFWMEAFRLDPANLPYRVFALDSLARIDPTTTLAEISLIVASEDISPHLIFGVAQAMFLIVGQFPSFAAALDQNMNERLERALQREEAQPDNDRLVLASARIRLAVALQRSKQVKEARRAFDMLVERYPEQEEALLSRAAFLMAYDAESAKQDMDLLIQRKTRYPEVYGYQAEQMLRKKNFKRCLEFCDQALQRQPQPNLRSALWEWKAICHAELGHNPRTVRECFRLASEADPFNENINRNLAVFERRLVQKTQRAEYDIPSAVIPPANFRASLAA